MTEPSYIKTATAFITHHPMVLFATSMMAGIIFAANVDAPFGLGILIAILAALTFVYRQIKKQSTPKSALAFFVFFGIGVALMAASDRPTLPENHIKNYVDRGRPDIQGTITKPVLFYPDHRIAIVKTDRIVLDHGAYMPVQGLVRVRLNHSIAKVALGDVVSFTSRLRPIRSYKTPGVFDIETFRKRRGQYVSAGIRHPSNLKVIEHNTGVARIISAEGLREKIRAHLQTNLPEPQNQIISALVLGEKQRMPKAVTEAFRKSGAAHLLAISGMHIGGVFAMVYLLLSVLLRTSTTLCRRTNIFKLAAVIALVPVFLYAELAGWGISTTRAFLMVLAFAGALLIGRQRDFLSALAAAAILILFAWPFSLLEPAFQLSFAAVFTIALVVPRFARQRPDVSELDRLEQKGRAIPAVQWLKLSVASTLGATLITIPITAYHFGTIAPYAFISNLLLVPLYTLIIVPLSLAGAFVLSIAPAVAQIFWQLAVLAINLGNLVIQGIGLIPGALVWVSRPTGIEIIAWYGLLLGLMIWKQKAGRILALAGLAVLLFVPLAFQVAKYTRTDLRVTVIDVGQGLSQLIEFPGGQTWLVDGGGNRSATFDTGEAVVGPFLRKKRIRTLDRVISTHPHLDHYTGLFHILQTFRVKEVVFAEVLPEEKDETYAMLQKLAVLKTDGADQTAHADRPDESIDATQVQWLHPPEAGQLALFAKSDINNRSLVMKLTYGDCSILLTADIEKEAEDFLIKSGQNLKSEVIITPHHGSKSSSTVAFIDRVNPKYAVIPVGWNNWYGFPSAQILENYELFETEVHRTDLEGTTEIRCYPDGATIVPGGAASRPPSKGHAP